MELGLCGSGEDDEQNSTGFIEISNRFVTQNFFLETMPFDSGEGQSVLC